MFHLITKKIRYTTDITEIKGGNTHRYQMTFHRFLSQPLPPISIWAPSPESESRISSTRDNKSCTTLSTGDEHKKPRNRAFVEPVSQMLSEVEAVNLTYESELWIVVGDSNV